MDETDDKVETPAEEESKQVVYVICGGSRVHDLARLLVESGLGLVDFPEIVPRETLDHEYAMKMLKMCKAEAYDNCIDHVYYNPYGTEQRNHDYVRQKHALKHQRRHVRKWR